MRPFCARCYPTPLTLPRDPARDEDGEPSSDATGLDSDASLLFPGR